MSWHWLRHDWTKWEQYICHYTLHKWLGGGDGVQKREKRQCRVCGKAQDRYVGGI